MKFYVRTPGCRRAKEYQSKIGWLLDCPILTQHNRYIKFDKEVDLSLRPRLKGVGYRLLVVKGKTTTI